MVSVINGEIDREAPRLKVIPEEHEKRRAIFWELLNMDCRMVRVKFQARGPNV